MLIIFYNKQTTVAPPQKKNKKKSTHTPTNMFFSRSTIALIMSLATIMSAPHGSYAKLGDSNGRRAQKEEDPTVAPAKEGILYKHPFGRNKDLEATDSFTKSTTTTTTTASSPLTRSINNCADHPGWYDGDGSGFGCDWYAADTDRCGVYGDSFENFGRTANEACCACGGCIHQDGSSQVADTPCGWYDADGPAFDCNWYSLVSSRCEIYGNNFANFGKTANQACHTCGGGTAL